MRVFELSDSERSAAFCGKLFARWGADVVKVESPHRERPEEALDRYLNGGKRRVALDYRDPASRRLLDRLAAGFDVVVTDAPARDVEELGLLSLGDDASSADRRPRVRTSITPFGLSGPYRDWEATPSTLQALGGYTFLSGDAAREPLTLPGQYPYHQAGTFAYISTLAALLSGAREQAPQPATIEVSVLETLAALHQFTFVMYTNGGRIRSRHGNRWENLHPTTLLPCADGWFSINVLPQFWEPFALMLGRPDLIEDERFATNNARMEHADELDEIVREAFVDWSMERVFREGQETWRVPIGYMMGLQDTLDGPHLAERAFWRPLGGGELRTAGSPFRFVGAEPPAERDAVPPGTDTEAVLGSFSAAAPSTERARPRVEQSPPTGRGPLDGVRIIDLTRIWSGPLATRILADLGADVIKVEAPQSRGPARLPSGVSGLYPGGAPPERHWNRQGLFNKLNRNKRSVALDLKTDEGRRLFLGLVAKSDIVIENFSARAMPGLDLGYERMREANERIIYIAMPAFGLDGPYRDYIGLGPSIEPLIGLTALMGYSDEEPRVTSLALTDAISGVTAASAMITALDRRERTGEGALVDLSQHEAGVALFGEHFIERQLTGREPERLGNASVASAPHGVYRCRGEDEWIAIAAGSEPRWQALSARAGRGWSEDSRFATAEARLKHRAALDDAIEAWTVEGDKFELMSELQAVGVAAGAVLSAPEMLADPHLEERGFFVEIEEHDAGTQRYDGSPLRLDGERGYERWGPSPVLGGDNDAVLRDLLGCSASDIARLYEQGVIADRPPG